MTIFFLPARVRGFETEEDIIRFYRLDGNKSEQYPITVIFDVDPSDTALPSDVTYTIRPQTRDDDKWQTQFIFSFYQVLSPRKDDKQCKYQSCFFLFFYHQCFYVM